jgi:hypothetical protein
VLIEKVTSSVQPACASMCSSSLHLRTRQNNLYFRTSNKTNSHMLNECMGKSARNRSMRRHASAAQSGDGRRWHCSSSWTARSLTKRHEYTITIYLLWSCLNALTCDVWKSDDDTNTSRASTNRPRQSSLHFQSRSNIYSFHVTMLQLSIPHQSMRLDWFLRDFGYCLLPCRLPEAVNKFYL